MQAVPNNLLQQIYASRTVQDASGQSFPVHSQISSRFAAALYQTVRKYRPKQVVEIGMAYGISSLAILTALHDLNEGGQLISVDPHQTGFWKGIGVANVQRSGLGELHQLREAFDYVALPELLREAVEVDFAYVDGTHTFDHVLLDFFYLDKLLRPGGVIGFNDCKYRAVDRVLRFIRTHRRYRELDVGLHQNLRGKVARIRHWPRNGNDRYFLKVEDWKPAWDYYARF